MSLLNTLKAIKDEGFDPKTDKINGNGGGLLGSGTYPVRLISSEMSANKAGYEQIVVQLEVVSGNDAGRKEIDRKSTRLTPVTFQSPSRMPSSA